MSRTNPKTDVDVLARFLMPKNLKRAPILPADFKIRNLPNKPCVKITQLSTSKEIIVGICDLQGAFQAIRAFCTEGKRL